MYMIQLVYLYDVSIISDDPRVSHNSVVIISESSQYEVVLCTNQYNPTR